MPLDHAPPPRFTPEQRDAILDLAARLQNQHEATLGLDELMRAAGESGLDARFVHEAVVRLGGKPRIETSLRGPVVAFCLLALQAVWIMLVGHSSVHMREWSVGAAALTFGGGLAFVLSAWAARAKPIRRLIPAVAFGTWAIVWLSTLVVESQLVGLGYGWVTDTAFRFGVVETLAAVAAVLARNASDWRPEDGRSFRLRRGA